MSRSSKPVASSRALVVACYAALAALALMTWQLFDPRPVPVLVAMSLGQVLGTASFVAYLYVVLRDLRAARKAARRALDDVSAE